MNPVVTNFPTPPVSERLTDSRAALEIVVAGDDGGVVTGLIESCASCAASVFPPTRTTLRAGTTLLCAKTRGRAEVAHADLNHSRLGVL